MDVLVVYARKCLTGVFLALAIQLAVGAQDARAEYVNYCGPLSSECYDALDVLCASYYLGLQTERTYPRSESHPGDRSPSAQVNRSVAELWRSAMANAVSACGQAIVDQCFDSGNACHEGNP